MRITRRSRQASQHLGGLSGGPGPRTKFLWAQTACRIGDGRTRRRHPFPQVGLLALPLRIPTPLPYFPATRGLIPLLQFPVAKLLVVEQTGQSIASLNPTANTHCFELLTVDHCCCPLHLVLLRRIRSAETPLRSRSAVPFLRLSRRPDYQTEHEKSFPAVTYKR